MKQTNDVILDFPHKDCVCIFDASDKETFYKDETDINKLLAPKAFEKPIKHDADNVEGYPVDKITSDDNLIIHGDNLFALHSLAKSPLYRAKVKLMYWDIPYNTHNDKVPYDDKFKHSSWLIMMKNRLEIAKELLREDGVMCLQCDDNEQAYLTVLADEIFGRDNRINTICLNMSSMSGQKINNAIKGKKFPKIKEYLLVYAMNKNNVHINVPKMEKEEWDDEYNKIIPEWKEENYSLFDCDINKANNAIDNYSIFSLTEYAKANNIELTDKWKKDNAYRIFGTKSNKSLLEKAKKETFNKDIVFIQNASMQNKLIMTNFNKKTKTARIELVSASKNKAVYYGDIWMNIATNGGVSQEGNVSLPNGKKPESLIYDIIRSFTEENDIVLDAFLGSGTTASVCQKMNRKYVGIEQLKNHFNMVITRLKKVINGDKTGISKTVNWNGGGSFIECQLAHNINYSEIKNSLLTETDISFINNFYTD